MSDSGIVVTYSGSEALLDSTAFSHLIGTFSHHLPLRNLHWKPSSSYVGPSQSAGTTTPPFSPALPHPSSIRTIQTLGVRLEPIADTVLRNKLKPETRHLIQRSLLERPFCHLYFVVCDDSDAYRHHIRNDIRTWLATVQGTPALSAAAVTARGFQGAEYLQHHRNGSSASLNGASTQRADTPPIRVDSPSKEISAEESGLSSIPSSKGDKVASPSPEYLIVVVSPPEGSTLPQSSSGRGSPAPSLNSPSSAKPGGDSGGEKGASSTKTGLGRFYSSASSNKGSVIDKVKADFNTSRRERVIHLNRLPSFFTEHQSRIRHSDPTIFAELLTRLKECVSATFDAVVDMQGDILMKEGQKRHVPGWNYCKWMAGMECIVSTFEGVGLYSDAVAGYEEIEASFQHCLQERNLPFFSHVGGRDAGDDSAPLLDVTKKNYRDLILRNEISLFDFRSYVFARRAILLGKLGRVSQVMNDTPIFLSQVATMLQSESLPQYFIESWIFSCSIDVVEQCQAWLVERGGAGTSGNDDVVSESGKSPSTDTLDIQLSAAFHSAKADLLDQARRQLDKIGVTAGHLPRTAPFAHSLPFTGYGRDRELPRLPNEESDTAEASGITRMELLSAIESREVFDLHYISLSERVIASWTSGGRQRSVLRLRFVLGSLDFVRGRYEQAYSKFTTLSEPYAIGRWSVIEASHLAKQLECHAQLKKTYDRAWLSILLALSKALGQLGACRLQQYDETDPSSRWLEPSYLITQLRERTKSFAQEVPISRFEPFSVQVSNQVAQVASSTSHDGTHITVNVETSSGCDVEVDDVRVCLLNGASKELWFQSGKVHLSLGSNRIRLFCHLLGQAGRYKVDVSQIRISKVIMQYLHRKGIDERDPGQCTYVDVIEDGDALDVQMELSKEVWLDRGRVCLFSLWTGRNNIQEIEVQLRHKASYEPVRGLLEASLVPDDRTSGIKIRANQEHSSLILESIAAQSIITLSFPLHEVTGAADGILTFLAELSFVNKSEKSAPAMRRRQVSTELRLPVGLPLGVNVQDFFRGERLFSKFLISAPTGGLLRLGKVQLECETGGTPPDYEIVKPRNDNVTVVTPDRPASYLFSIRQVERKRIGPLNRNMRLTIFFRTLQDEAVDSMLMRLRQVLSRQADSVTKSQQRALERAFSAYAVTSVDAKEFAARERLHFTSRTQRQWRQMSQWAPAAVQADTLGKSFSQLVAETTQLEASSTTSEYGQKEEWRTLSLVVDVPQMSLVNAVTIDLDEEDKKALYVGRVVRASISVETSFYWGEQEEIPRVTSKNAQIPAPSSVSEDEDEGDDAVSFQDAKSEASAEETDSNATATPGEGEDETKKGRTFYLSVDVQCDFTNWLLIGSKRTIFKITEPSDPNQRVTSTMEASLMPIKSGDLCLPSVTIWPLAEPFETSPPSHAHRDKESNAIRFEEEKRRLEVVQSLSCDSHIVNEAQTVMVLPTAKESDRRSYWMAV